MATKGRNRSITEEAGALAGPLAVGLSCVEQVSKAPVPHAPGQRIDKYLWFVRLAKSRSTAQAMAEQATIRLNGRRVDRAHSSVRVGDILTLPRGPHVIVIRIKGLPQRRGSATEAQNCYEELKLGE